MYQPQTPVAARINEQLHNRINMKYGWRKELKTSFSKIWKILCYAIIGRVGWSPGENKPKLDLGVDLFGRDVAEGVLAYVELIKKRGFQVNTVLVLGSRAKGRWKPDSDVDVTLIASNIPKGKGFLGLKRWLLLSDRPICMGIEASACCSRSEFLRLLEGFDLMALDAVLYGKVICDDGFWAEVEKIFKEMEEKYKLQEIPLKEMLLPI